jgi:flagellar protein FliO/FliZ
MTIRLILIALLSYPLLVLAETSRPAYAPVPPPASAVSSGSALQIIFSLILVLAAVALAAWIMKRINLPHQGAASLLKVVSGVAVGPRERVVLMEVNDTWLIVGIAPGQVRTLHTMPKGVLPAGMSSPAAPDGKFQIWLKQMVEKRNAS